MSYHISERETLIRFDEVDFCWYFQSNVRKHINKILKYEHYYENVKKEIENGIVISIEAKLSDLKNFSVMPFVRAKRKLSATEKQELINRFSKNLEEIMQ